MHAAGAGNAAKLLLDLLLMQGAEGRFDSTAALLDAERPESICKSLLKWHVRLKRADGPGMQQEQGLLSSFCLCHY